MPGLDVIRGVAIGLVLLRHSWPGVFPGGGIVGVVMFFALSGYLITGVLDRQLFRTGNVDYRVFYLHRAFRLVPALLAMLLVFLAIGLSTDIFGSRETVLLSFVASLLYLNDLPLPFETSQSINTLWTLAVEEQFYLVWPALLAFSARRGFRGWMIVAAVAALVALCSISAALTASDLNRIYALPTTWASTLVIGSGAYFLRDRVRELLTKSLRIRASLHAASLTVLTLICFLPAAKENILVYVVGGPAIALSTIVLIESVSAWRTLPTKVIEPFRLLGLISYACYVWNSLVQHWYEAALPDVGRWALIPTTIAIAVASWYTVEAVGRAARRRYDSSRADVARPRIVGSL